MRAGQADPAPGVGRLVAPVTVRVYFTRPRAGADQTNRRSQSLDQKQLHRGSRTCLPFAPNQDPVKEDTGCIASLDGRRGYRVLRPTLPKEIKLMIHAIEVKLKIVSVIQAQWRRCAKNPRQDWR